MLLCYCFLSLSTPCIHIESYLYTEGNLGYDIKINGSPVKEMEV